ncbi:MAG: 50S ribosomal protein L25 [Deltaproteobacteria bacterium]|nr:MAG: 50S ribosomal protein L25 [Deltaproteobacteria bacterium]
MEAATIQAERRDKTGKGICRALRREGKIPAVMYGPGVDPVGLSIDGRDFVNKIRNENILQSMIDLVVDNTPEKTLIRDVQTDPLSGDPIHVDFYKVDMNRKVTTMVNVETEGKSVGEEFGGLVQVIRRQLEVKCLPEDIPDVIKVNIEALNIGDAIHVEEIEVDAGVELVHEVNFTVITLVGGKAAAADEEDESDEEAEAAVAEE